MKTSDLSKVSPSVDPRNTSVEEAKALSLDDRMTYFCKVRANHPKLAMALKEVEQFVDPVSGGGLVLLVGPAGVGKSEIVKLLKEKVLAKNRSEMLDDPGFIPIVVMDAATSGDKAFSWKNFYLQIQRLLGGQIQSTIGGLRDGVERTLYWRRTQILVIDEGVHLFRGASDKSKIGHIDSLKSLASMSGVIIILVGSYDLLAVLSMSGQIARRTALVHFPRYLKGPESEDASFKLAMKRFVESMPIDGVGRLLELSGQLHLCTHGCIGVLKKLLEQSLKRAMDSGGNWKNIHLLKSLPTAAQLDAMIQETAAGEELLAKNDFESGAWDLLAKLQNALQDPKGV